MFKCPKCGDKTTTYAMKRTNGEYVYGRYRKCPTCGHKFSTIERLEDVDQEIKHQGYVGALNEITKFIEGIKHGNHGNNKEEDIDGSERFA